MEHLTMPDVLGLVTLWIGTGVVSWFARHYPAVLLVAVVGALIVTGRIFDLQ